MNLIPTDDGGLVAINVFTVKPENQHAVIDTIRGGGDPAGIPGLRAMHLLRSTDGTKVINHMHWDSEQALRTATRTDPRIVETARTLSALIEGAQPGHYEVIPITT
jgi:heme-degrading monooxygenase HmoA